MQKVSSYCRYSTWFHVRYENSAAALRLRIEDYWPCDITGIIRASDYLRRGEFGVRTEKNVMEKRREVSFLLSFHHVALIFNVSSILGTIIFQLYLIF